MITKPMLAGIVTDFSKIKFPVLATPKIDGIRCLRVYGYSVSRTFKRIPNKHIQQQMQGLPDGLDGELIIKGGFQKTTSGIMSRDGEPDFEYWVFDYVPLSYHLNFCGYNARMITLKSECLTNAIYLPVFCKVLYPIELHSLSNLQQYEKMCLENGHEGIMIRQPNSPYKCGRSTEKEGYLLKIKRFEDAEAVITGFEEQMENCNELGKDELGHAKRSTNKDGKLGKNTLGSFIVKGVKVFHGQEFRIGTGVGLTQELRREIWDNKHRYWGKLITYKYQPCGTLNLPRLPIFKGFRGDE